MTMTQEDLKLNDYYSTSDLGLATALSLFYPIEVIDHTNPSKAKFLFKQNEDLDPLIETYWRNEMRASPQTYFNQLRVIKSRLYEERQ